MENFDTAPPPADQCWYTEKITRSQLAAGVSKETNIAVGSFVPVPDEVSVKFSKLPPISLVPAVRSLVMDRSDVE